MPSVFDRRVVPEPVLELVKSCQNRVPCHLGGGAALAGVHLGHRLSRDIDLVCHDPEDVRTLERGLPAIGAELGLDIRLVRDAGTFVRALVGNGLEIDALYEGTPDLEAPDAVEGVQIESLADLRAAKLTCILSRSEPRDLVDLLFLDRLGYPPERDLPLALRKDAGIDPGILAWLLGQFPLRPLPEMLKPITERELAEFRDDLRERLRRVATGE
ncbi:MAG: nucleotidyl transferase AbiEii/AbiGii toxin family protein [Candidatus Sericytochromatia bacterium]|nr:nucleotidyl transferase AbiEii/AbiGii toxin family protein [Candidatus Tanganyikabacteria bacterium]